jgi:hypothetical protein
LSAKPRSSPGASPARRRFAACAGECFGVGVQSDDLELPARPLDQQREVAGPATDPEDALCRFEPGLLGQLVVGGLDAHESRERFIQRQQPIEPHARQVATTRGVSASERLM